MRRSGGDSDARPSAEASGSAAASGAASVHGGVKETAESLIIAFILAFVFRAFVVEAFVIPTGSMAPTLYGKHGTIVCRDCGTEFAYGLHDGVVQARHEVSAQTAAICPNCNHTNTGLKTNDRARNAESGDRILVLKWPFDIGGDLLGPARWDVVVFKNPAEPDQNFIKRLAGEPGEVLMLMDGDVYTVATADLSAAARDALDGLRAEKYALRTGAASGRLSPVPRFVRDELERKLRIARKTRMAQRSLWFTVYDHDYPPQTPDAGQPRWRAGLRSGSGWDTSHRRIRFTDVGRVDDYIELVGKPIVSTCAYNVSPHMLRPHGVPVSDMRIRFVLTPEDGAGAVRIRLVKRDRAFWATLRADGVVTLSGTRRGAAASTARELASVRLRRFAAGRPVDVAFENVDYRVAVYVDGVEVLATSSDADDPASYRPDVHDVMTTHARSTSVSPRIYASGGAFALSHVVVDRDVYYTNTGFSGDAKGVGAWASAGWGTAGHPILLRDDEFFMLGDNSAASKDSRLWDKVDDQFRRRGSGFQLGTVPRDQLVGKAFFVYWPMGHRLPWLPAPLNRIGLIPDVGRMRWIR
ncbi:MAG: S26 family signal peptidase [Phycisphaerae bacterium]